MEEARQVAAEIAEAPDVAPVQAPVALIFDYDADFAWAVQPHGQGLSYFGLVFDAYRAMRSLGLSVDILPPDTVDFSGYKVIAAPGMMHMPNRLKQALADSEAQVILGPRTGARDRDMTIPVPLPPALPGLDVTVARVESLRPGAERDLRGGGQVTGYCEVLETTLDPVLSTTDGAPVAVAQSGMTYLGAMLDQQGWRRLLRGMCETAGIETIDLPTGVRQRDTATERFWFNHEATEQKVGDRVLPPASVTREPR